MLTTKGPTIEVKETHVSGTTKDRDRRCSSCDVLIKRNEDHYVVQTAIQTMRLCRSCAATLRLQAKENIPL